jgi:gentisate 1,2-dioxygenase
MASEDDRERFTRDARYYEYSKAADPIGEGLVPPIPLAEFPRHLHEQGPTQIVPLDLGRDLRCAWPATSPSLLASFIHIRPGERLATRPHATSELYFVLRGRGHTCLGGERIGWSKGDLLVLPANSAAEHRADEDAALYWVHDEPLLRYLGVTPTEPRFEPTLFPHERAMAELRKAEEEARQVARNRVSVLLANAACPDTRTITHVIWAMLGVSPAGAHQPAHRHQSVALDLIIDCQPGCYTLVGDALDEDGRIKGARVDWKPASVFVTPPGLWHAHYNESGAPAYLLPIQDAGLHTYLRTLDIRFTHPRAQARAA